MGSGLFPLKASSCSTIHHAFTHAKTNNNNNTGTVKKRHEIVFIASEMWTSLFSYSILYFTLDGHSLQMQRWANYMDEPLYRQSVTGNGPCGCFCYDCQDDDYGEVVRVMGDLERVWGCDK